MKALTRCPTRALTRQSTKGPQERFKHVICVPIQMLQVERVATYAADANIGCDSIVEEVVHSMDVKIRGKSRISRSS